MKESLFFISDALRLSAHVLTNDPTQLTGQLFGRMLSINSTEIQDFLRRAKNSTSHPWLHPLNPALSQVDEPLIWTLTGHPSGVNCVAIAPDGPTAVSGSGARWEKGTVLKIWNLDVGQEIASIEGPFDGFKAVAITPNGRLAVTGCGDGTVRIWDLEQGVLVHSMKEHRSDVNDVAVTPDGRHAVSCSDETAQSENLLLWDIEQGRKIRSIRFADEKGIRLEEKRQGYRPGTLSSPLKIQCISVSPDGRFAVFGWEGVRRGWTAWDLKRNRISQDAVCDNIINSIAFLPDGKNVITASGAKLKIWNLKSGAEKQILAGHSGWKSGQTFMTGRENDILAVAVSQDGRKAITASADRTLKLWNLKEAREEVCLVGHSGSVNAVALDENSHLAVSGSSDKTVKVWDLKRVKSPAVPIGHFLKINTLSISPDGRFLVSGSDDNTVKIWDLEKRQEIRSLKGHQGSVLAVAVTPDNRYVVSSADLNDGTLRLWDLINGDQVGYLKSVKDSIRALALTPDGRNAVYGFGAGIVRIDDYRIAIGQTLKAWNLDEREAEDRSVGGSPIYDVMDEPDPMKDQSILTLAVMPDNKRVITGSTDKTLKIWELNTWAPLHTLSGHSGSVQSVAVTREGKYAVSGSSDQTVRIWDLIKDKPVFTLKGHTGIVSCVSLTPCDNFIVSASHDSSLKIWSLANGELIASFTGEGAFTHCVAAPDGRTIVIGDVSGRLLFLYLHFPDGFEQSR
jgi:WD40 repeat protein